MTNSRIGIYGGTFNPIHHAHLLVAQTALDALNLDRVIFVPAGLPPLKGSRDLIDGEHRLEMVRLAIADNPKFSVDDFEIRRAAQKSYTIDTVRYLATQCPVATQLFFILGDDCTAKLPYWNGIEELQKLVQFVCVNRNGNTPSPNSPLLLPIAMPGMAISSTDLRARLRANRSIRYLTPDSVAEYIDWHRLYREANTAQREVANHA